MTGPRRGTVSVHLRRTAEEPETVRYRVQLSQWQVGSAGRQEQLASGEFKLAPGVTIMGDLCEVLRVLAVLL